MNIGLRQCEPLQVENVCLHRREPGEDGQVLRRAEREACAVLAEAPPLDGWIENEKEMADMIANDIRARRTP